MKAGLGQRTLTLRMRLLGLVALSTVVLVGVATAWQLRLTLGAVEHELLDAASATALGVSAELTERSELPSATELEDIRATFAQAVQELLALTVTSLDEQGRSRLHATTDPQPHPQALGLAQRAVERREITVSEPLPGALRLVAVPLERDRRSLGAVVVTLSMERVERVRREVRVAAATAAPLAVVALIGAIALLGRELVDRPLESIRETMRRASSGDLEARARVHRPDEIGRLAEGLNAMLDRMRDFNVTLREEVERATGELQERSAQLSETAQRLFSARRELARSEQLAVAGRMAATVAHQVGTPLNLISGYVQMMLEELPPASVEAQRLRTVQEQIGRVTAIVQGLLDQARRPALLLGRARPESLVEAVAVLARPSLERARIALATRVEPGLPELEVDVGQLEQAFLNLVTNSIDAMPKGGDLVLGARAAGDGVEFVVSDSGCGVAPQNRDRVFDPLFTTKQPGKGTGLGLTIVRDVVAAHGGGVSLRSEPDRGTEVVVRLPRAPAGAGAARA
jgi:two-component system, NtrC family, sensor kinase